VRDYEIHLVEEVRAGRLTRRELVRRASVVGLSLTTVGGLLAACGGGADDEGAATAPGATAPTTAGEPKRGGTLRVSRIVPGSDPDPVTIFDSGGVQTVQLAGEYLVHPGADNVLEPRLATEWEPGPTPQEWTFAIRQGVKWHDGSTLTVDDVVATFERLTDPAIESSALSAFAGVLSKGGVERLDDEHVRFNLDRAFADFPYLVSNYTFSAIILPANHEVGTFTRGGVGTGAFVLESYTPQQGARYVRNPDYWNPELPYLDAVDLVFFDDTPPIVLAMQAGEIDYNGEQPFAGAQPLFGSDDVEVYVNPSSSYRAIHMRTDEGPFAERAVRQALAYSLDREALVQGLFDGRAEVGNDHAFAPIFPTAPEEGAIPQRAPDYERARQLLADAGHPDGIDVELTTQQFLEIPQLVVFMLEQARQAGIRITPNILTPANYYGGGDPAPWLVVPFGITDWAARGVASQTIAPAYRCDGVWNSAHWCNEEYDRLVAELDAELDEQRRRELALRAAEIQHEEVPAAIPYWLNEMRAARKRVKGVGSTPRPEESTFWLDDA
jgi:peptide/nickel transport system substrate-binding protein